MPALIFDCDGVLADTERYGHLPAFNQTFREFGLPVQWSEDDYAQMLLIGGGKERMTALLTPEFIAKAGLPTDEAGLTEHIAQWHRRKTEIYTGMVEQGVMPARPGVRRLAQEAADHGWLLAVASTSAQASVQAVLNHVVGDVLADHFTLFAGDVVDRKKPAPDIYQLAISQLQVSPDDGIAVEDSHNGMAAALAAGLRCVVTTSSYTGEEDFSGASLVVSSLGEPASAGVEAVTADVVADPLMLHPGPLVDLATLGSILANRTRTGHPEGQRR